MTRGSRNLLILAGLLLLLPAQLYSQVQPRPGSKQELRPQTQQAPPRAPAPPRSSPTPMGRPLTISQVEGQGAIHDRYTDRNVRRQRTLLGRSWTTSPESWNDDWDWFYGTQWRWATYIMPSPKGLALVSIENGVWIRESEGDLGPSPVHVTTADPPLEAHFAVRGAPGIRYGVEVVLYSDIDPAVQRASFDSRMDEQNNSNSHAVLLHVDALEPGEYTLAVSVQDHGRSAVSLPATVSLVVSAPDGAVPLQ